MPVLEPLLKPGEHFSESAHDVDIFELRPVEEGIFDVLATDGTMNELLEGGVRADDTVELDVATLTR